MNKHIVLPFRHSCPLPVARHQDEFEPPIKRPCNVDFESRRESLHEKSLGPLEFFGRQRFAFTRKADLEPNVKGLRIFCQEIDENTGERKYILTTVKRFWYWFQHGALPNLYELIEDETPCRLYFDLEFSKEHNKDVDSLKCYKHFLAVACDLLKEMYNILTDAKHFLALDSSTSKKFSCHLIAHLPDALLFPSATSIRPFIAELEQRLLTNRDQPLYNQDGKEIVLFDKAVYSRNRTFRTYKSSKLGKNVFLTRAAYCDFYGATKPSDWRIFCDSLCVPISLCSSPNLVNVADSFVPRIKIEQPAFNSEFSSEQSIVRSGESPFPHIEEFLRLMMKKWCDQVHFRQWKLVEDESRIPLTITFYPSNCRFCFNVKRQHKSNQQYWVINLKKMEIMQRCFDPECRGFESNHFPIPSSVKEATQKTLNSIQAESVSDVLDRSLVEFQEYFANQP